MMRQRLIAENEVHIQKETVWNQENFPEHEYVCGYDSLRQQHQPKLT